MKSMYLYSGTHLLKLVVEMTSCTYTVTVSPLAQLSATVLTSTSVTVTAQYNVDYTVSVVATNCAGSSTTAEYDFRISELTASYN